MTIARVPAPRITAAQRGNNTGTAMTLALSVLDQSLARSADQASAALQETLQMARWCEQLGYTRFWVSEHHAFSLLSSLYPGRIDLGIGRAPGADMPTATALAGGRRPRFEDFPQLSAELAHYLWEEHTQPVVSPRPQEKIPLWMLGSSADSAVLAAERGLPYNLGLFINPQADSRLIGHYKKHFRPSALQAEPYAILALSVFCADSEERARLLQLTYDINLLRFFSGQSDGRSLTPEEVANYPIGPQEEAFIASRVPGRATGTPAQVRARLEYLAELHQADEIMAVSNMYYCEDRKRCFELLRDSFAND